MPKSENTKYLRSELSKDALKRAQARDIINNAIKAGNLNKGNCRCGSSEVEAHHKNYDKPLDVSWHCIDHHPGRSLKEGKMRIRTDVRLLETKDGSTWDVCLLEFGVSKNGVEYSEEIVRENLNHFEDVKAFCYEFKGQLKDHVPEDVREGLPQGTVKNLVGYYKLPRIGDFQKPDGTTGRGVLAKFHVTADWLKETLSNAFKKGKRDLLGFSIDGLAKIKDKVLESGKKVQEFLGFEELNEVTVVTHPSAGGILINLSESYKLIKESQQMKELLKGLKESYPDFFGKIDENLEPEKLTQAILEAQAKLKESLTVKPDEDKSTSFTLEDISKKIDAAVQKAVQPLQDKATHTEQMKESRDNLKKALEIKKEDGKPVFSKLVADEILSDNEGRVLKESDINAILKKKQSYVASLQESGLNFPGQEKPEISVNKEEEDKLADAMTGMLIGEKVGEVEPMRSLHESYRVCNPGFSGPSTLFGRNILREAAIGMAPLNVDDTNPTLQEHGTWRSHLRESRATSLKQLKEAQLTTSLWGEVFGDSVRRALMKMYDRKNLDSWRKIVSLVGSAPDFRTNRRQRIGGFGNLSAVSEGGTYQFLDYPTDEEVSFAVTKRGNLTELTLESMVNDDLGAVKQIVRKLGVAAAQTLHEFVFDFINDNVTLDYDSVALFNAAHNNIGTVALSTANSLDNRIIALADQTEQDSGKVLGITPRYLLAPNELIRTTWEQIFGNVSSVSGRAETIENWFKQYGMDVITVGYWTDANNWYLVADPAEYPTIEIDFLNGQQEPEIFIQDMPTVGSVFSADKITYKIRHIYGGDVLEHRSFDGSIVA